MSANGHLKFQGTNRATFVGETSNIMFDTTTTSLGIGVTGTDHPSSNLYITGNAYVSSNIAVGGVLTMGTVNVVARHDLESVTATGNTTPLTVEFQNADTSLVTTGNVEVGKELVVSGNTETKNINMLHTANTASIKLNSNVVTEFPRSKKLIKYPRVAMTSGQSGLNTGYTQDGYTIQVSSEMGGVHMASNAFNSIQSYQGTDYAWLSSNSPYRYTPSTGIATSDDTFQGVNGSWIGLTLPEKIKLSSVHLYNRRDGGNSVRPARKGIVWGSDGGSTWYRLKDFTNGSMDGALNVITVESDILYDRFRVQITEIHNDPAKDAVAIGELEFYGVPEYDSDAHGTDVIIKSKANVPNTDWLEVYYDGQDYTSIQTTVDNKTGVSAHDATITNSGNITFDSTYRAWKFGGDNTRTDTFIATLPSTLQGNQVHSVSTWFKYDVLGDDAIFSISPTSGEADNKTIGVRLSDNPSYHLRYYHWSNDALVKFPPRVPMLPDTWYNLVVTYNGIIKSEYRGKAVYINGEFCPVVSSTGLSSLNTLNLDSGSRLQLGRRNYSNGDRFFGSIANFRLFNRVLSSDEIYQLYAYQKSFFGHGDLSMTLKSGRLGIGTSEPRATLDVRGDVLINGYPITSMYPGYASGGDDVYDVDGYRVHAFTSSGTLHIPSGDLKVDILLVGGGGGGGQDNAGAGGAGGLVIRPGLRLQSTRYAITIGSGGLGCRHQNNGPAATAGEDTKIETHPIATGPQQTVNDPNYASNFGEAILVAKGGGNGNSGGNASGVTPPNGGSGGGGASEGSHPSVGGTQIQQYQTSGSGESATYGFGNNGGNGVSDGGGGGGGAGDPGQNGNVTFSGSGGNGGDGKCSASFSGLEANFADMFGTRYGEIIDEEAWFAGGGGGANRNGVTSGFATGGKGGGGTAGSTNATNGDGLPNTGGGGAGAFWHTYGYNLWGGDGGSGIVLLRYKL